MNTSLHKFHIPVMGLGFTIDTPVKVAHYGIDSVLSIVDDDLIEKMRGVHCLKTERPYEPISTNENDYRAKRITAYLNLLDEIVRDNFEKVKNSFGEGNGEFEKYISLLPEDSPQKILYNTATDKDSIKESIVSGLKPGSIDVNIMTKLDKANYSKNEQLPVEFNDAHAALRGYANSNLRSSIVFSAGMNPRLYSYIEEFKDFYPDENGEIKKKIILKVSDYRSALIQGKFLAKKGLWVSEYRIESGLNCGGHAFATEGFLMGPILEEFKTNRDILKETMKAIYTNALAGKNIQSANFPYEIKITAQGGIGTNDEQNFLLEYYGISSVGWGTPFLLVPEATNIDDNTMSLLCNATEDDLYLSRISPLGVPFNSVKGSSKDLEKMENAANGRPGSPCPKKYLQLNTEFSEKPICSASRTYQAEKIKQLKSLESEGNMFETGYEQIIEKACLCVGLATSALMNNNAATKADGTGVLVCPGPNLAYFSSVVTLKEMLDHIYGRINLLNRNDRPNMFINELKQYLDYLEEEAAAEIGVLTNTRIKYFKTYMNNLTEGIQYYKEMFSALQSKFGGINIKVLNDLYALEHRFEKIKHEITHIYLYVQDELSLSGKSMAAG